MGGAMAEGLQILGILRSHAELSGKHQDEKEGWKNAGSEPMFTSFKIILFPFQG
jgi:hypothetical protein